MFHNPSGAFLNLLDSSTLCCITAILLLSLISVAFVFHLRLKSRSVQHLQRFNSLWMVRLLLVLLIAIWASNELFRLSFFRRNYLFPFFPSLTLTQQASFCKIHIVFSLGFFEPGFLVTLLFLINVSTEKKTPHTTWAIAFVLANCFPVLALQVLLVFFSGLHLPWPEIFLRSSVVSKSEEVILCQYPLMSSIVFGAFGIWYLMGFSLACFKAVNLVINKGLRRRICALSFTVMIMLPLQILFLVSSVLWSPEENIYATFAFFVFGTTLVIAAVGEGILVIKPTVDSLVAGEDALPAFLPREQTASEEQQLPKLEDARVQVWRTRDLISCHLIGC